MLESTSIPRVGNAGPKKGTRNVHRILMHIFSTDFPFINQFITYMVYKRTIQYIIVLNVVDRS